MIASLKSRSLLALFTLGVLLGTIALIKARVVLNWYQDRRTAIHDQIGVDIAQVDQWLLMLLIAVLGVMAVRGPRLRTTLDELGLNRPLIPALWFALLASLPMMIGYAITGSIHLSWFLISVGGIYPLIEEVFFRGWAFRQLAVRANWGFWPAALVTGLIFGLAHLPTSRFVNLTFDVSDLFTVLLTGTGGAFFAWLYMKWNWNLWVPFLLHGLMNTWWAIFASADGAVGGLYENIFRAMTIAAAVFLTICRDRVPGLRCRSRRGASHRSG